MKDLASMFKDVCLTDRQVRKKQARINRGFDPVWAAPDKWEDLIEDEGLRRRLLKKAFSPVSIPKGSSGYVFDDAQPVLEGSLDDCWTLINNCIRRMVGRSLHTLGTVKYLADRRERIQQRWDARLLQRLNQHTAPAKGSPRRSGRL